MLIGSSSDKDKGGKKSEGAPSLPQPPITTTTTDDPSTGDTSVEASPNLGAVNGGFTQGEEKSRLATNLLLRLQSRAQQSWDVPTSLSKAASRGAASTAQQP